MSRQRKIHPKIVEWEKGQNLAEAYGWKHQPRWRQRIKAMGMETKGDISVPGALELSKEIWVFPGTLWDAVLEQVRKEEIQ